ncbi:MAG: B3/B4 domain-containing protein [Candidatus Jordarchaeum sp.]|uniref:B3/B4 domain-containing protein n=1 Tax=Candidatus Jordarchaeum sp. TaxID=2823881 RepID=UPI004049BB65
MLVIDSEIKERFPDLNAKTAVVEGVRIEREKGELEEFKQVVFEEIKRNYDLEGLKDDERMRKYRDFFWKINIDPTKIRPASEALIRRILQEKPIPRINTAVDSYNLASIKSGVPLAAFDLGTLDGGLNMRFSREGEFFLGIGMKKPKKLIGGEIVVSDSKKLVAIYPYRDSDDSKITLKTKKILLMSCGVPGISDAELNQALEYAMGYIKKFC